MSLSCAFLSVLLVVECVTATNWVVNFHNNVNGCGTGSQKAEPQFDLQAAFRDRIELLQHGNYSAENMAALFGPIETATLTETSSGTVTQVQNWEELASFLNTRAVRHKVVASTISPETGYALFHTKRASTVTTHKKTQTLDLLDDLFSDVVGTVKAIASGAESLVSCIENVTKANASALACIDSCQITVGSTLVGQPTKVCAHTGNTGCSRTNLGQRPPPPDSGWDSTWTAANCAKASCVYKTVPQGLDQPAVELVCDCVDTGKTPFQFSVSDLVQDCINLQIPKDQMRDGSPSFAVTTGSIPGKTLADCGVCTTN
eukprot:TRINITY_DN93799_c0_g1_i1.p1 TRINITY_DN93799_c0_g1~~TRINITY_DN93799_c0_g1_i1.p1  ORF type:complete len:317 (-),score=31.58 TRINITY_DN93799_c0_g1_i1:122-1072(-)